MEGLGKFAVALAFLVAAANAETCFVPGEVIGTLIGAFELTDPTDCLLKCEANVGCNWFTHHTREDFCALYSEMQDINVQRCPSCVSGQAGCSQGQCNLKGQCSGTSLDLELTNTHGECQTLCSDRGPPNGQCQYYTYHFESKICELFDSCENTDSELCKDCVSGQPYCGINTFIMTVGGLDASGNRSGVVELTTLNPFTNPIQPCYEVLNLFPVPVADAAGGPIDGYPHMCGGQSNPNISANCFGYDFATDTWNILGEMPEPKVSSNNAYDVHWGLVMAGGQVQVPGQQGFQSSESVDETMDGLFFNRLENLPVPSSHGCLVALDENRLFFAGGRRNDGETSLIDRAAIYNRNPEPGQSHWREVLPLPSGGRADLSCGAVRDATGGAVEVVVAGGGGDFDRLEVDIYDIRANSWRVGDTMPGPLRRAAALSFGNSFMLVGGQTPDGPSGAIWLWDSTTSTFDLQPATLTTPRAGETAFFVEAATFPKCDIVLPTGLPTFPTKKN